jgi:glycosyltransferase involved in cell wall biosynthesis
MFSIYILTHNEELDIGACIESALLSDDIIVVDSLSTDGTEKIVTEYAQNYPVRFVPHAFESHGKQRTWMLQNVPHKHEWIYILEADERMTPELFQECLSAIKHPDYVGYYVAERVMFMGKWIRRSTQYPRYQMRLLRPDKVWFDDYGHTEREVYEGSVSFLKETYPHYTCSKGFSRWIEKHNRYSTDEARETIRQLDNGSVNWRNIFLGKTEIERRHALKNLSHYLPARPLLRFFYMYLILGAVWDGYPGFTWCVLQAFYEHLITLKVWEIRQRDAGLPV